jgi:hypothetical protein
MGRGGQKSHVASRLAAIGPVIEINAFVSRNGPDSASIGLSALSMVRYAICMLTLVEGRRVIRNSMDVLM